MSSSQQTSEKDHTGKIPRYYTHLVYLLDFHYGLLIVKKIASNWWRWIRVLGYNNSGNFKRTLRWCTRDRPLITCGILWTNRNTMPGDFILCTSTKLDNRWSASLMSVSRSFLMIHGVAMVLHDAFRIHTHWDLIWLVLFNETSSQ